MLDLWSALYGVTLVLRTSITTNSILASIFNKNIVSLHRNQDTMIRHLANIVTSLRIVLSGAILVCPLFSVGFYIAYAICGISDMVDGTIARRTKSATELGARLDTIADSIFAFAVIIKIAPILDRVLWVWIAIITSIKLINITVGYIRYHKLISLHTSLNRVTGAILFITPFTLLFIDQRYLLYTICPLALLSALHEGYLTIKGETTI